MHYNQLIKKTIFTILIAVIIFAVHVPYASALEKSPVRRYPTIGRPSPIPITLVVLKVNVIYPAVVFYNAVTRTSDNIPYTITVSNVGKRTANAVQFCARFNFAPPFNLVSLDQGNWTDGVIGSGGGRYNSYDPNGRAECDIWFPLPYPLKAGASESFKYAINVNAPQIVTNFVRASSIETKKDVQFTAITKVR